MGASVPRRVFGAAVAAMILSASCSDGMAPDLSAPLASISAGVLHTCGGATDGSLYCWGWNRDGQLGDGSTDNRDTPVRVETGGITFGSVGAGGGHTCALTDGGAAHCWGFNLNGQLGDGSLASRATPAAVSAGLTFATLSVGGSYTCGVTTAQIAHCWGWNAEGQLGDGSGTDQTGPVAVAGGLAFVQVSAGNFHTCGVTTTGQAYCWGRNGDGQLGNGTSADTTMPALVGGGLTFVSISAGSNHTCGVTDTQEARCWGSNSFGQLGIKSTEGRVRDPTVVFGGRSFRSVSAGALYSCGLTTSDAAFCWGFNNNGQLATDSSEACFDAVNLVNVACIFEPVPSAGSLLFTTLSAATQHTCGIARDGIAYCWGLGSMGQLGNGESGETVVRIDPVRVAGQM